MIAIPGMMTGAILGGSSVETAAKLQMVIMFMLTSATTLGTIFTTISAIAILVDSEHRVRSDRIDDRPHEVWRAKERMMTALSETVSELFVTLRGSRKRENRRLSEEPEELQTLLQREER